MKPERKVNCWELMRCEREPGGNRVAEFGVCPASVETSGNGINEGINSGRCCWAIAGTMCFGEVQGTSASKIQDCMDCGFFWAVADEETDFTASVSCLRQSGRKSSK
jgi:hypothetical protein